MRHVRTMATALHLLQALLLTLLLSACDRAPEVPRLSALDSDARILAFGDSLTYGTGAARETAYPAVLAALIGREVINAGIPGETSGQGLERLPDVLEQTDPALVILCLGGNDMLRKHDRAQMKRNLGAMIELIRARGVPVVLLGVPEPKLMGLETEAAYHELASDFGVPLEAGIIPDVLGDKARKSDQIHPNAAGYADMARAIAELLKKTGAV
jgi:acyl-CoA thioesterase I